MTRRDNRVRDVNAQFYMMQSRGSEMTGTGNHRIKRNPRPILGRQYAPERQRPLMSDNIMMLVGLGILALAVVLV